MNEKTREQVIKLCEVLDSKKAMDIKAIYVADKTIIADWFIICSGRVASQVKMLADELEDEAYKLGLETRRKEGYQEGRWVVLDFADILVHIFIPEEREYYNMERLWAENPDECISFGTED